MEWTLLFLLLPVAALSGWLIGRQKTAETDPNGCGRFSADYFKGLNYLLNEQSDKAIEVFVSILEVDSETVETHFALANLFLRRGEVDRAIRIHQNLIARPTLTHQQRQQALFELGKDYLRAGLLDRAETMLLQTVTNPELAPLALRHLLEVYMQEREWHKATEIASKLRDSSNAQEMGPMIAHFMCEEAEEAIRNNQNSKARRLLGMAVKQDKNCVRATLLESSLDISENKYREAITALHHVEYQDPDFLPEIAPALQECHQKLESEFELLDYLAELIRRNRGGSSIALLHAELNRTIHGPESALASLEHYLQLNPSLRVIQKIIEWKMLHNSELSEMVMLNRLIGERLENKPTYQCRNCGYASRTLNWQCPTCKRWNSVKPLQSVDGE